MGPEIEKGEVPKPDEKDIQVKYGGLKIVDFDDLKIAFIDLTDKHNKLAASYKSYRNTHQHRDFMETTHS